MEPIKKPRKAIVCIDLSQYERYESGTIVGGIWIEINGTPFPEQRWVDFIGKLIAGWTWATLDILHGTKRMARYMFMDGPLYYSIRPISNNVWTIRCVRFGVTRHQTVLECSIIPSIFCQSLLDSMISWLKYAVEQDPSYDLALFPQLRRDLEEAMTILSPTK